GQPDRDTGEGLGALPGYWNSYAQQTSLNLQVKGPFQLLGRQHELIVGGNWNKDDFDYHGGRDATYRYIVDMNNLAAFDPPSPTALNVNQWQY
ncbi:TonB-dependent siderophore receptor, partial [Cupriavidus sp. SIMBA_020]